MHFQLHASLSRARARAGKRSLESESLVAIKSQKKYGLLRGLKKKRYTLLETPTFKAEFNERRLNEPARGVEYLTEGSLTFDKLLNVLSSDRDVGLSHYKSHGNLPREFVRLASNCGVLHRGMRQ